ncbi:MAG: CapA family protein [Pseudomonadota bacterium]
MLSRYVWCLSLAGAVVVADLAMAEGASGTSSKDGSLIIVLGGDLGLGGSGQPVSPIGGYRHGKRIPWASLTAGIEPILNGDVNFANLETVVTDKRKLSPADKLFTFQMHARGARHLVDVGFNVFSTANNHTRDFGQLGMRETLRHLEGLRSKGLLAFPGLGAGRTAAIGPSLIERKGSTLAISALGIGGAQPGRNGRRFGQPSYHSKVDFSETLSNLAAAEADYKVLSAHYGRELSIRPSSSAIRKLRDEAVIKHEVDLVVGHHAHVAAGVQRVDRRLILYGLGNLLHLGMQDMAKFGRCRDFGLMVRIHLSRQEGKRLSASAIEAIPLTRMHAMAEPVKVAAAAKRIAVLNGLASELDHKVSGARGVRFKMNAQGHGVYCFEDAGREKGKEVHPLCRAKGEPLRDVGSVRCPRLSRSIVARSSRNRNKRNKLTGRRTAGNSSSSSGTFSQRFFGSVYGN